MNHVKFAPRVLAMGLLAASALSIPAFAAPADSSSTAIRVDRDPPPTPPASRSPTMTALFRWTPVSNGGD